jgi:hypothetical protein
MKGTPTGVGGGAAGSSGSGSGTGVLNRSSRRDTVALPTKAKLETNNNGAIQCVCGDNRDMGVMIQCEVRGPPKPPNPIKPHARGCNRTHARPCFGMMARLSAGAAADMRGTGPQLRHLVTHAMRAAGRSATARHLLLPRVLCGACGSLLGARPRCASLPIPTQHTQSPRPAHCNLCSSQA